MRVKSIEATDGHNHFLCVFFAVTLLMSPIALADLGAANSGDNSSLRLGSLDQLKPQKMRIHPRAAEYSANVL